MRESDWSSDVCSSDLSSLQIAKEYESETVKILFQLNKGSSSSRNNLFTNCKGKFIQYLDSDDLLAMDKIQKQLERLLQEGDDVIASGPFINFRKDLNEDTYHPDNGYRDFENPIDWLIESMWDRAMFPPMVWLTPRKLIEEAGPWNESLSYNDDSEFFARVLLKARKIVFCKDAVSYYRRGNPASLGSRKDRKARISELESLNLVTSHMLNHEDSLRVREACAYKYRKLIYSLYPYHKDLIEKAEQKLKDLNVKGDFDFGKGFTKKLGKIIGWKNAKLIRNSYIKIKDII
jgi:glycosyltransferase involved in cell wall biosynthesis